MKHLTDEEWKLLSDLISEHFGLVFPQATPRDCWSTACANRLERLHLGSFAEYYRFLVCHPDRQSELRELPILITNNETYFFREAHQFRLLTKHLLPELSGPACGHRPLRILSAGCSSGDEAYSIVVSLARLVGATRAATPGRWTPATSTGSGCCRRARPCTSRQPPAGLRRGDAARPTSIARRPFALRRKFLTGTRFFELNLAAHRLEFPGAPYDIIFCRNVLIYFSNPAFDAPDQPLSRGPGRSRLPVPRPRRIADRPPRRLPPGATPGQHRLRKEGPRGARDRHDDQGLRRRRFAVHPQGAGPDPVVAAGLPAGGRGRLGHRGAGRASPSPVPTSSPWTSRCPAWTACRRLKQLMHRHPGLPVVMLSAHTREGANTTLDAMAMGAMDFIDKSGLNVMDFDRLSHELLSKIEACRASREAFTWDRPGRPFGRLHAPRPSPCAARSQSLPRVDWDGLRPLRHRRLHRRAGGAAERWWRSIPAGFPVPVAVVQHMPVGFTKPFADRLNGLARIRVRESLDQDHLEPGVMLVARAGAHLHVGPRPQHRGGPGPAGRQTHPQRRRADDLGGARARQACPRRAADRDGRRRRRGDVADPQAGRPDGGRKRGDLRGLRHAAGGPHARRRLASTVAARHLPAVFSGG